MFDGHHAYLDRVVRHAEDGSWPPHLAAQEAREMARQALALLRRAVREARRLEQS